MLKKNKKISTVEERSEKEESDITKERTEGDSFLKN